MKDVWYERAQQVQDSIYRRYCQKLRWTTGLSLAAPFWPHTIVEAGVSLRGVWHYWWQAHYIDCAIDAAMRTGKKHDIARITKIIRSHYVRNYFSVLNEYYDDMAWLGLALQRADKYFHIYRLRSIDTLTLQFYQAWLPKYGGGIRWRAEKDEYYFNTAAAGPISVFHARAGDIERAQAIVDWVYQHLYIPDSGLIADGVHALVGADGQYFLEKAKPEAYTYNQGVILGVALELLLATGDDLHRERICSLVSAVNTHMTVNGVLITQGTGDGGLFSGILARYLAQIAYRFPGQDSQAEQIRNTARDIVLRSAATAWDNSLCDKIGIFFGQNWSESFAEDILVTDLPRDLSVQLSGWKLCEAAYVLESNCVNSSASTRYTIE